MAGTFEYTHPADDIAGTVTPVLSGATADPDYDVDKVANGDPADPFKCDATTMRLVWDFGAPVTVKGVLIVHHNLRAGLGGVKFQMHTADSWATPDVSSTLAVPDYHSDDYPGNIFGDLRPSNPSKRYVSLAVTSANAVNVAFGEVLILAEIRALSRNLIGTKSPEEPEDHPLVENQSEEGGVETIYSHETRRRWLRGSVLEGATMADTLREWNRAAGGRWKPFVILPHQHIDEPWFVRFEKSPLTRTYVGGSFTSAYALAFQECGRGRIPEPSAV